MSTTIDQKVVEMRFDNSHFEKHTRESMSTLDKLKQKLNLTGATKGLEDLNTSANKVNMSGMSGALDVVHAKFSALQVMGITALANITNSAVNAGKRITKALTIDPVMTGFKEYETQINAVQTILANTQKEGADITKVNAALDELNEYADKTIYNFTEMTRNIGTFTAAGVKLDTSVNAIKGIANLAAVSGSTSQQASTAMYQLSQALASGTVKLMDWNSVVNAGMGGQVFQDALKETARVHKINIDQIIKNTGSFRESLKEGWLTSEILTETLEKFTLTTEGLTEAEIKANRERLKAKGYTEAQIDEIFKLGKTATEAATKVKTFTQLWDVLKEAAQSGWAQTWRIIVGDFEEAKALFTPLADFLTGIINKFSTARNKLLEGALSFNPFTALLEKLENSSIGKVAKKVNNISKSLEYYQKMVNKVWRGDYKNQPVRSGLMEKEGHDYKVIQSLVNLGYKHKLTTEEVEKAEKKYGVTVDATAKSVERLSDEQLRNAGLTKEEIELYRELEQQSEKTGKSIEEIITSMEKKDGRTLLMESFKNVGSSLVKIITAIGTAWRDAFPPMSAIQLYNIIEAINSFSQKLKMSDETADKLTRTLKGVFAIVDLISMVLGGGLRIALFVVKSILGAFNMDILDFTAYVGDAIVGLRDWIEEHNYLGMAIEKVTQFVTKIVTAVKEWVTSNETIMNGISKFKEQIKGMSGGLQSWLEGIKDAENIPMYIIKGLINGLLKGAGSVLEVIIAIGKGLIEGICEVLGIHSPSVEFKEVGKNIILGLINGVKEAAPKVWEVIGKIGSKLLSLFEEIKISDILIAGGVFGLVGSIKTIAGIVANLTQPIAAVNNILNSISGMFANMGGMFKDFGQAAKTKAMASVLKSIALVIVALAGSVYILSKIESGKLWSAVGAIAVLTILAGGLYALVQILGSGKKSFASSFQTTMLLNAITGAIIKLALSILILALLPIGKMWSAVGAIAVLALIAGGLYVLVQKLNDGPSSLKSAISTILALSTIANALFMMALAVRILATADPGRLAAAIAGFTYMVTAMGVLILAFSAICKDGNTSNNISQVAGMLLKMSAALLILAIVTKLVAGLSVTDLLKGSAFMLAFVGFVKLLVMAASVGKDKTVYKIGGMLLAISVAMLLMVAVIKLVSLLKIGELIKGAAFMLAFVGFVKLLVSVLKVGKESTIAKVGGTILAISTAMLLMSAVMKIIGGMDVGSLIKGAIGVAYLVGIVALLVYIVKSSTDAPKIAGVLLALSGAIGILALATKLLSTINVMGLIKGIGAIGLLGLIVTSMVKVAKDMKGSMGSLIVMTVAIGVMAIAVGALSTIPFNKLAGATVGLGALMGIFTLMIKATENAKKATGTLVVLTIVIAVLGGILFGLSKLPIDQTLGAATALSLLLGVITGVTFLLSKMGGLNAKALLGILGLAAICGLLYIVVDVLKRMDGIQNAAQSATVLGAFMGVLAIILLLTAAVGAIYTATAGIAATGLLGMLAVILMIYPILGALAIMSMIPDAISNLTALQSFLITMTAILVVLAVVGPFALIGVTAMYALTALMVAIGVLATSIGALMTEFPSLKDFLDKGLPVLIKLAGGIGEMIGAFVSGIMVRIASKLPFIGLMLSQFMVNALPFIHGAKLIDDKMTAGVKSLAAAVLVLTAADLISGVASFMSGGKSFSELGTELSEFMKNALPFILTANLINPNIMDGVKTLAEAILVLTAANLVESIGNFLGSDGSLETFGSQLKYLGKGLREFLTTLGPIDPRHVAAGKSAAEIIKSLAEASKEIPNTGGLLADLIGDNDLSTWATQLPLVGEGIAGFINVLTKNKINDNAVTVASTAAQIITKLAEAAKEIPNAGGLLADLVGDNDLTTFANGFPTVGKGIAGFVKAMQEGKITPESAKVAVTAAGVIKTLANVAKELPNTGGLLADLIGDEDLTTFADTLPRIGSAIALYAKNLGDFTPEKVNTVNSASAAIRSIAELGKVDLKSTGTNLSTFGKNLIDFAKKVVTFVNKIAEASSENITAAIDKTKELLGLAQTVANTEIDSLNTFGESLKSVAKEGVNGFVEEFEGKSPKERALEAGEALVTSVEDGVKSKKDDIIEEAGEITESVVKEFESKSLQSDAKIAGEDLATGFANGIKSNDSITKVSNAGTVIGKAALAAAKKAIDSNSPSKEAMKIGNYFGQGLVIGINDYQTKSYDAGYGVAEYAKNGLSRAISRISNLVSDEIDAQPTIRPVLDLSEIESGAGYLNTMFDNGPSIGVTSNLNAISSGMNTRIQNGTNSEVVSAINKLRKDLGNVGGDTYNINGVSYADTDTDINNAVRTLVRAATIERRI